MTARADDPPPEAGRLPTSRLARTARVGGMVTGQGLRWAGMRAANPGRSPERAEAARDERTAATVRELVEQLGRMRGAAMKVGQLFSMIDLEGLPEEQRAELQSQLASLRDDVPPVPFRRLERLIRKELGMPLGRVFAEFDERAFAAASIGQVHRATTLDGDDVVVKVQYPGVAEAVDSDLRSASLLVPLIRRLAPSLDAKGLLAELRDRVGDELDYELEAQHQRRVERLLRGHPFILCRACGPTSRRVACSSPTTSRASASRRSERSIRRSATATARSSSASTSGCSTATASRSAIRIPATTCCVRTIAWRSSTMASCAISAPRGSTPSARSRPPCAPAIPPGLRTRSRPAATCAAPTASTPSWRWR